MKIIEGDNHYVIPIYYNLIESQLIKTFGLLALDAQISSKIVSEIKNKNREKIFAIDMQFVSAFPHSNEVEKVFSPFCDLKEYKLLFYNIQSEIVDPELLFTELGVKHSNGFQYTIKDIPESIYTAIAMNFEFKTPKDDVNLIVELNNAYISEIENVVLNYCTDSKTQYLPSSDVYSNKYIQIKSLFANPSENSFCIYLLCKMIRDCFARNRVDAIIGMSNTGSILANLVGKMLGKDVVYCSNLGPRFALDIKHIKGKINKDLNYICVFDFVCLGTEIKNLKTLLRSFEANLIGGVGVSAYPSFDYLRSCADNSEERNSILTRMYSLINVDSPIFKYEISIKPFASKEGRKCRRGRP